MECNSTLAVQKATKDFKLVPMESFKSEIMVVQISLLDNLIDPVITSEGL